MLNKIFLKKIYIYIYICMLVNKRVKVEVVTDFLFLGSKITADCDCSHEIRR